MIDHPDVQRAWQRLNALHPNPAIRKAVAELLDAITATYEAKDRA